MKNKLHRDPIMNCTLITRAFFKWHATNHNSVDKELQASLAFCRKTQCMHSNMVTRFHEVALNHKRTTRRRNNSTLCFVLVASPLPTNLLSQLRIAHKSICVFVHLTANILTKMKNQSPDFFSDFFRSNRRILRSTLFRTQIKFRSQIKFYYNVLECLIKDTRFDLTDAKQC